MNVWDETSRAKPGDRVQVTVEGIVVQPDAGRDRDRDFHMVVPGLYMQSRVPVDFEVIEPATPPGFPVGSVALAPKSKNVYVKRADGSWVNQDGRVEDEEWANFWLDYFPGEYLTIIHRGDVELMA